MIQVRFKPGIFGSQVQRTAIELQYEDIQTTG